MLRSLRCCVNPKVIGCLAMAGLVVWVVAPATGAAALPLLIALICPLSMLAMMGGMRKGSSRAAPEQGQQTGDFEAQMRELREEVMIAKARQHLAPERGDHRP